ncbi:PREDICTED: DELLA protein RGL1-like [Fragaria vesca subsp. vesca]|uniref:DELLA protein RGL1-like n=1 Tax=Fragaria vesca subsp. vesca TaxID=101020 RepID=UPI0002C32D4F|nr:PREDICTED: DELLA protein RGL1-like [Fragaria vesca subsp. vesca]
MANTMFSFGEFNYGGVQDKLGSAVENMEVDNIGGKQVYEAENWGSFGSLCSDYGIYGNSFSDYRKYQQQDQQQQLQPQLISDYGVFDDMQFQYGALSPPLQACLEEIAKLENIPTLVPHVEPPKKELKRDIFPVAGLDLLNNYGSGFKRLNGERIIESNPYAAYTEVKSSKLSTEEIMRVAGARFIRTASQVSASDIPSMLSHPFELSFAGLSDEESRDVELVEFLLASAEKVGYQQYERATKLLTLCEKLCSDRGNPVERVVFYFCEALRDKIDRETGRPAQNKQAFDMEKAMMSPSETSLACHNKIPFGQVAQFAGIQAIVEKVAEAKKVHVIDLEIRSGVQWTVLMQALASRDFPLELLKISAVGTSKEAIQNTGKWLESFAKTMNLPFSFQMVMVPDMLDLKEDMFELDSEETVAVYSQFVLRCMVPQPDRLESVMRVIKSIHPSVTVVTEVEANHNSPVFVTRFIETLFFFSAFFDCVETCIEKNDPIRESLESQYFGNGIKNIVATEGEERKIRHVKIDIWRAFFARYGMEELELSSSSLYQAELVSKKFPCGSSCTITMDGKTLLAGWKGTPLQSLSLWKFV